MRDQQQPRNRAAPRNDTATASDRAAEQLDRYVEQDHEVEALVGDMGDQGERRGDDPTQDRRPEASRAQLRAMTPPHHDSGQIDQMADASARVRPGSQTRTRRPWWRRVFGWAVRRR